MGSDCINFTLPKFWDEVLQTWNRPLPSWQRMAIRTTVFPSWRHLKQLSQYEWFVSRTETPYQRCQIICTRSPSYEIRKRPGQVWELGDLNWACTTTEGGIGRYFNLVNTKVSLCSARWESQGRYSFRLNTTPGNHELSIYIYIQFHHITPLIAAVLYRNVQSSVKKFIV